jgi:nicotinamide-nucleotide amidase
MKSAIVASCCVALQQRRKTIAFAESATAGRLMAEFSMMPDAGTFLKGGFVCYDACLKQDLLQVPERLIAACSPESAEVTEAIAKGLVRLIDADIYIGVTGLTAPGGSEGPDKPVGTMFIHACGVHGEPLFTDRVEFRGDPETIVMHTAVHTAALLKHYLQ